MKSWPTASLRGLLVIRVVGLGMCLPLAAIAQTRTWDNGNNNALWGDATNWSGNTLPSTSGIAQFAATDNNSVVNDIQLQGNQTVGSLTFANVDDNFSIVNGSGSRTLTLTTGDITRSALSIGHQTISATTLALGGDAVMAINGTTTSVALPVNNLTIASNIIDSGGSRSLTKSGTGELILSGNNTYSGDTALSAGKLTLASASALGSGDTLTISGGTLKLSTATTSITNLVISGNSTIDFGGAVADLSVTNLTIMSGFTLNIINWVNASDHFYATNWLNGGSGAGVFDTSGATPMNQVVFNSPTYNGSNTKWLIYGSHEITPVPEPSTYGALLLAASGGLLYWRRRRLSRAAA